MKLGIYIKNERQKRKVSQEEVAKSAGISRNYLAEIENGYVPSFKVAVKLANLLNLDLNLLRERNYKLNELCYQNKRYQKREEKVAN